jgi:hypothetical protein
VRVGALRLAALALVAGSGCLPAARGAAPAGDQGGRLVLVELYTSQGCSSCPAADAFVRDLPRLGFDRRRVVPLTFHVDYWDDLGWKDPFATRAFTDRQRRYADLGRLRSPDGEDGLRGLYTPQMIVDGAVHFSGGRRDVALREIQKAAAQPSAVALQATAATDGDRATVSVRVVPATGAALRGPFRLFVVLASTAARTRVTHGENSGRTLEEAAIVRALSEPVRLDTTPTEPVTVTVSKPTELPWSTIELDAILASETSWNVLSVQTVPAARPVTGDEQRRSTGGGSDR